MKLKDVRKQLGLKQGALAHLLGVTQSTVSRWERGMSAIPQYVWDKISEEDNVEMHIGTAKEVVVMIDLDRRIVHVRKTR